MKPIEAETPPHPFQTLTALKGLSLYLLCWLPMLVVLELLKIHPGADPRYHPFQAGLWSLLEIGINVVFAGLIYRTLHKSGIRRATLLGPWLPRELRALLPTLVAQLLIGLCGIELVQLCWPSTSQMLQRLPVYLPIPGGSNYAYRAGLLFYNLVAAFGLLVAAPVCEELIFRGWLMQRLLIAWRRHAHALPLAMGVSALSFGLLHGQHLIGATCFGLLLNAIYFRTASLRLTMLLHSLYNLSVLILSFGLSKSVVQLPGMFGIPLCLLGFTAGLGIYSFQLRQNWPASGTPPPLLPQGLDALPPIAPRARSPYAQPADSPLARISLLSALSMALVLLVLAVAPLQALEHWLPSDLGSKTCGCLLQDLSKALAISLILGPWLLWLRWRCRPRPLLGHSWLSLELPAGSGRVLAALLCLLIGWRWLSVTQLNRLDDFAQQLTLIDKNWYLTQVPPALSWLMILTSVLIGSLFEQTVRQLAKYRCPNLSAMLAVVLPAGLMLQLGSPVTTLFVSGWLLLLGLKREDPLPLLRFQLLYYLLFWAVRLPASSWLSPIFAAPGFALVGLLQLPALAILVQALIRARRAVAPAKSNETPPATA